MKMTSRVAESAPEWWDDELDELVKGCVVVFGEDSTDDTIIRVTERYSHEIGVDDVPVREALVPLLVEAFKSGASAMAEAALTREVLSRAPLAISWVPVLCRGSVLVVGPRLSTSSPRVD